MANGIINRAVAPQQQQGEARQPEGQPVRANQIDVERVVAAAIKIIHDPKVRPQLLQMMKAAGDPVQALVDAAFLVMGQINEKANGKIPSEALGAAAFHVLNLLAELADASGLYKITPEIIKTAAATGIERLEQMQAQGAQPAEAAPQEEY